MTDRPQAAAEAEHPARPTTHALPADAADEARKDPLTAASEAAAEHVMHDDNDLLTSVEGIFNGTTNVILTKIFEENLTFGEALKFAQANGFAESDPTLDVEGFDPKFKLCILLLHAFGVFVQPEKVLHFGIHRLNDFDIEFAKSRGSVLKLVARCFRENDKVAAYCLPRFVPKNHRYDCVRNEYNAVTLESAFSERQVFVGKGAGDKPTGCAVLSDISALRYRYKYEYRKFGQNGTFFDTKGTESSRRSQEIK